MKKHWNISIKGKVQGVYYRATAKTRAVQLGITGFVQNQPDGTVYAEAEGEEELLRQFVAWCKSGPKQARVELVSTVEGDLINFDTFEIR